MTARPRPVRRLALAFALALPLAASALSPASAQTPAAAPAPGPRATVEAFHATLLEAMKQGPALGYAGREKLIAPAVERALDLAFMSKAALGRHWASLDPATQQKVLEAFTRWSVANYASQFAAYDGERFETLGEGDGGQGTTLVRTQIVEASGKTTPLDYRMRETPQGWRAVDVLLDGTVSQLALYRADYSAVLERSGVDGLLATLSEKTTALATAPPKPR